MIQQRKAIAPLRMFAKRPVTSRSSSARFMTQRLLGILGAIALLLLFAPWVGTRPAQANQAVYYDQLEFPPLPAVELPDYTRFELNNGIVVYLVEDHELPLVNGSAYFRAGSRLEPSDKIGIANMVGTVMRSGGTPQRPPEALNQFLEDRAASVETGIDEVAGRASFSSLSEDLDDIFEVFADVIRHPAFPEDKLELTKNLWRGSIARRNDSPEGIAGREFAKLIYGADNPYARTVEYATVDAISHSDLVAFHQQYFHPNNMLLGIVGDFQTEDMRSLIEQRFGDWQRDPRVDQPDFATLPAVAQATTGGVFLVDQPQLTQSYIQLGHLGGQLKDPDYTPLSVLNDVLNGLGGRMVNELRSRQGLAYSVYAYWSPQFDHPGLFFGGGQTRSEATLPFIQAWQAEIEKVRTSLITETELQQAKDSSLNAFVFNFETPVQTLARLIRYEYYSYPNDFIFRYQKEVEATTVQDIQRAAQTYLKPDKLVTLVVGNRSGIQPSLDTLGSPVIPVDIAIPN